MRVGEASFSRGFGRTTFLYPAVGPRLRLLAALGASNGRPPYIGGQLTCLIHPSEVDALPLARSRALLTPLSAFRDSNFSTLGLSARASARALLGHLSSLMSPDPLL
jgi:hypothetical protein